MLFNFEKIADKTDNKAERGQIYEVTKGASLCDYMPSKAKGIFKCVDTNLQMKK